MTFTLLKRILGISGMLLLAACQDIPFFSVYQSVDVNGWQAEDALSYKLPEVEDESQCDVAVAVRTKKGFKYEKFALAVRLYEGKKVVSVDTLMYSAYDECGQRVGTGFPYVEQEKALRHSYKLKPGKKYKVKISHIMRLNPFDGICDVGLTLKNKKP